jgi:hypothetical protein
MSSFVIRNTTFGQFLLFLFLKARAFSIVLKTFDLPAPHITLNTLFIFYVYTLFIYQSLHRVFEVSKKYSTIETRCF